MSFEKKSKIDLTQICHDVFVWLCRESCGGILINQPNQIMNILEKRRHLMALLKTGLYEKLNEYTATEINSMPVRVIEGVAEDCGITWPESEPKPKAKPEPKQEAPKSDDLATILASAIEGKLNIDSANAKDEELRLQVEKLTAIVDDLSEKVGKSQSVAISVNGLPEVKVDNAHKDLQKLVGMIASDDYVLMSGAPGTGKTHAAKQVAEALQLGFYSVSVCAQTTQTQLLGYMDANGQCVRTPLREAYENGGLFVLDEIDNGSPNTIAVLNSALSNGELAFADGMVKRHKDFRCIATANTLGFGATEQFLGRLKLDSATRDRFGCLDWIFDTQVERAITGNQEASDILEKTREWAKANNSNIILSVRSSVRIAKYLALQWDVIDAVKVGLTKGHADEEKILKHLKLA